MSDVFAVSDATPNIGSKVRNSTTSKGSFVRHAPYISLTVFTASVNLKLAELHYATRLEELRGLIKTEEDKFKCASISRRHL